MWSCERGGCSPLHLAVRSRAVHRAMAQPRAVALRASNDRLLDELQLLRQKVAEHERREVVMREDLSAASKHIRTLMEPNVAARVFSIGSKADEAAFTAAEPEFSRGALKPANSPKPLPKKRRTK